MSFTVTAAREWIARQHAHATEGTAVVLATVLPEEGTPVGMVGLFGLDQPDCTARLGYWVIASHRGRGIATSAARMLTDWAFAHLQLTTIYIDREPLNRASARLADKLGAVPTGSRSVSLDGRRIEFVRHSMS